MIMVLGGREDTEHVTNDGDVARRATRSVGDAVVPDRTEGGDGTVVIAVAAEGGCAEVDTANT